MQSNANNLDMMRSGNARKTAYAANQHSVSIMGSDAGRIHIPSNIKQSSFSQPPADAQINEGEKIPRTPPGEAARVPSP